MEKNQTSIPFLLALFLGSFIATILSVQFDIDYWILRIALNIVSILVLNVIFSAIAKRLKKD